MLKKITEWLKKNLQRSAFIGNASETVFRHMFVGDRVYLRNTPTGMLGRDHWQRGQPVRIESVLPGGTFVQVRPLGGKKSLWVDAADLSTTSLNPEVRERLAS